LHFYFGFRDEPIHLFAGFAPFRTAILVKGMKLRSEQPPVSDGFEGLAYFQELVHFFFRYAQVSRRVRVLHPCHYQESAEFSKIGQFFF
jgi:hypothetical protein